MSERPKPEASRTITGLIIPHLGSLAIERVEIGKSDLRARQRIVQGLIEAIDIADPPATIWANDEAKLIDLPFNARATACWWLTTPAMRFRDDIRGDTLLVGQPDLHGNDTSVPTELAELLTSERGKVVEAQRIVSGRWVQLEPPFDDFVDAAAYAIEMNSETGVNDVRVRLVDTPPHV